MIKLEGQRRSKCVLDVNGGQQETEQNTANAEPQIRITQKRIIATNPTRRSKNHCFVAVEHFHRVCYVHSNRHSKR